MAGTKKEHSIGFTIGAQLKSSFSSAFKNVEKQMKAAKKTAQDCGKAWKQFGKDAAKLVTGVTAMAAGIATAVWKITDSIGDQALAVERNASELRMSTEEYQKLQYAFEKAGIGADDFTGMLSDLDRKMIELASDSKAAKKWGEEYGLSAKKLASMTPEKRIERLADYFASLKDPIKKDQFAMEMFGRSAADLERVLGEGSQGLKDAGQEFVETGALIKQETIEQADAYKDMKTKLTTQVTGIRNQLFASLLPAFTEVFGTISDKLQNVDWAALGERIVAWVNNAVEKLPEIVAQVGAFIDRVKGGIQTVVDFVGGWENVAKIVGGLMAAKTAMSGVKAVIKTATLLTNPWVLVIAAVAAAVYFLIKNWETVKEVVSNVINTIKSIVTSEMERIKAAIGIAVDFLTGLWNGAIESLTNAFNAAKDFIAAVWEGIQAAVQAVLDYIVSYAQTWVESVSGIFQAIADFFIELWENLKGVFQAFVDFFVALFTGQWDQLGEKIRGIWEAIKNTVKGVLNGIVNIAKSWVNGILNVFKPITDFFSGIGNTIASIFGGKQTLQVDVQTTGAAGDLGGGADAGAVDLPGHAAGGIFTRPHIAEIAEGGDSEAVVPLNNKPASRSIWETAGRMAGFSQTTNNSTSHSEAPIQVSMPITISGNADADTVRQLTQATAGIEMRLKSMIQKVLADNDRQKVRLGLG